MAGFTTSGTLGNSLASSQFPSAGAILNKIERSYAIRPHKSKSQLKSFFMASNAEEYRQIKRTLEEGSRPVDASMTIPRPKTPEGKTIEHGSYESIPSLYKDVYKVSQNQAKQLGSGMDDVIDQIRDLSDNQFEAEADRRIMRHALGTYQFKPTVSSDSAAGKSAPLPVKNYLLCPDVTVYNRGSAAVTFKAAPSYLTFQQMFMYLEQINGDTPDTMGGNRQDLTSSKFMCFMSNQAWTDLFFFNNNVFSNRDWHGKEFITRDWGQMNTIAGFPITRVTDDVLPTLNSTTVTLPKSDGTGGNIVGTDAGTGATSATAVVKGIAPRALGYTSSYSFTPTETDGEPTKASAGTPIAIPGAANGPDQVGKHTMLTPVWKGGTARAGIVNRYGLVQGSRPVAADIAAATLAATPQGLHRAVFMPTTLYKLFKPTQFNRGWKPFEDQSESLLPTLYREASYESIRCFEDRMFILHWAPTLPFGGAANTSALKNLVQAA